MFVIVWRFTTFDAAAFERHYGRDGTWAELFRRDREYIRTDLLIDGQTYWTLDWWTSPAAYAAFRALHAEGYAAVDRMCESITSSEEKIGEFTVLGE
jgi:hypothetical protein